MILCLEIATCCGEVTAVGDSSRRWFECSEWVGWDIRPPEAVMPSGIPSGKLT